MSIRRIVTRRFCLSLGAALAIAIVLVANRRGPAPDLDGPGVVFVYFPSLCAAPRDPTNCQELPQPSRPAFQTMAACWAYADHQLLHENNPRIMVSCMKEREG